MSNEILTGSQVWFQNIPDFYPSDIDYIRLIDNPQGFQYVRQTHRNSQCIFEWKRMTPQEYIDYALQRGPAMQIGKFLTPEFVNEINFTIEHLKQLQPLVDRLDTRHQYQKIIYDSYIQNNDFVLTDEQLYKAYESYKQSRIS